MASFVLVHGSWHGAWCWKKVLPQLEAAGHRALAIDLPGHGADLTPIEDISLDGYAARICEAVAEQPGPVVLVGHSMGGGAITQAAEYCADKLARLVYLTAYVPSDGESIADQALSDADSLLTKHVEIDTDSGYASLPDEIVDDCFYGVCSAADIAFARRQLRLDPLAPLVTPLAISLEQSGSVPRVYIECLRDRTLTPGHQVRVRGTGPWEGVFQLDTDHSPFLSAPERLVSALLASDPDAG